MHVTMRKKENESLRKYIITYTQSSHQGVRKKQEKKKDYQYKNTIIIFIICKFTNCGLLLKEITLITQLFEFLIDDLS